MRTGPLFAIIALVVPGLLVSATEPSSGHGYGVAARPDLTVAAVTPPASTQVGGMVTVTVVTRNSGRSRTGPTSTTVVVSPDNRMGRDVSTAAIRVPGLRPGRTSSATVRMRIPAATAPRVYQVLACADTAKKVREAKEGNNCRVASRPLTVRTSDGPFPVDPDPVAADAVELDSDNAVTELVDPDEAGSRTIRTTATDGTTYTLAFHAESLLTPEKITMTPLVSATVPILSGGFRAGVRLEPEGLMLAAPATLTIESGELGPLAEQTPYVFHEEGADFHQHPVGRPLASDDADTVRLPLAHFSVAGVAGGTDADRAELADHPPVRDQAQAEAAIAEITRDARESGDMSKLARVVPVYEAYYENVVDPLMVAAESDVSLAQRAIYEGLAVSRMLYLLGGDESPIHARVMRHVERIVENAVEHYRRECFQQHDLEAITTLVGLARMASMLLGEDLYQRAWDSAQRCGQFEVEYEVTLDYDRDISDQYSHRVDDAHFRLVSTVEVDAFAPGVGPLAYAEAASLTHIDNFAPFSGSSDSVIVGTTPGALTAAITTRANPIDPGPGGEPAPPTPYVRIDPGKGAEGAEQIPEETHRWTRSDGVTREEQSPSFYSVHSMHWNWGSPWHEIDLQRTSGSALLLETTVAQATGGVAEQFGRAVSSTVVRVTHTPDVG